MTKLENTPNHILITGASSGLGAALARYYAPMVERLTLLGRSGQRLERLVETIQKPGLVVKLICLDVCDSAAMAQAVLAADQLMPVDLIIANAGIGGAKAMAGAFGESQVNAHDIASVNFCGVINTVSPIVAPMVKRGRGHIVFISSLSAIAPMPMAPTYGASKAGVSAYAHNLRHLLRRHGVKVTLVEPGFISTPMSDEVPGPQPLKISADAAAEMIALAIKRGKARLAFPFSLALLSRIFAFAPDFVVDLISARLARNNGKANG